MDHNCHLTILGIAYSLSVVFFCSSELSFQEFLQIWEISSILNSLLLSTLISNRYWLVETRNPDNVTSDARLLYRKLTAVPYLVKIVVFAKVEPDGTEGLLRIFCVTDDNIKKTLEQQTGFVEVARSRDVEVCEGRPVHVR